MVSVTELVDRIRSLCKSQKTSLTKLEEEFGWANGTIGKWGKRSNKYPPHDKLLLIANALGVSVSYLTGEEQKEKPTPEGEPDDESFRILKAFWQRATPEQMEELKKSIEFIEYKYSRKSE